MPQAKLKTQTTSDDPIKFIDSVEDLEKKEMSKMILKMMERATKSKAKMWGETIVGFGDVHLKYESGRELDWFKMGFSPRKGQMTLYILNGSNEQKKHLDKLGKFTTGKGCLYIKKLEDINVDVLEDLINVSADKAYGQQ